MTLKVNDENQMGTVGRLTRVMCDGETRYSSGTGHEEHLRSSEEAGLDSKGRESWVDPSGGEGSGVLVTYTKTQRDGI